MMKGRRSRSVDVLYSRSCVHVDGQLVEEDEMLHLALDGCEPRVIDGKAIRSPSALLLDTSFSPLTAMRSSPTRVSVVDERASDSPIFVALQPRCCRLLTCKQAMMLTLALVLLTIPISLLTSVILMRDNSSKSKQPQIVYVEEEQGRNPFFWELDQWSTKSKEELNQEIMRLEIRKQLMDELYRNSPAASTLDPEMENLQPSIMDQELENLQRSMVDPKLENLQRSMMDQEMENLQRSTT